MLIRARRPFKTEAGAWIHPPNVVRVSAAWAYRQIDSGAAVPARVGVGVEQEAIVRPAEVAIAREASACRTLSRQRRRRSR